MCCPGEEYGCSDVDQFMGHRSIAQALAKYIAFTPALHYRSPSTTSESTQSPETLDIYIARVIHASQVPENVPYAALYLLASVSQSCNCQLPQEDDLDDEHPAPSRLSHKLSQMTTRTPFSRISKSHWSARHIFIGAFFLALLFYGSTLPDDEGKKMHCGSILSDVSGMSVEELGEISTAFGKGVSTELQTKLEKMLLGRYFPRLTEVICPFSTAARQRRLSQAFEGGKGNGQKRRLSLRRSVSSFWRSPEKDILAPEESIMELESQSSSLDFWSPSPDGSFSSA